MDDDTIMNINEYQRRVIEFFRDQGGGKDPLAWQEMARAVMRASEDDGSVPTIDAAVGFASGTGDDDFEDDNTRDGGAR